MQTLLHRLHQIIRYNDLKSDILSNGEGEHTGLLFSQPCQSELHSTYRLIAVLYGTGRPIPVAARSKAWVCDRSLAGIAGSNATGGMNVCVLCVVR